MDEPRSLAAHLADWLEEQRTQLQPSTLRQYTGTVNRYLLPQLGDRPVAGITHRDITSFYRRLLLGGGLRGKPLALATVQRVAAMTHKVRGPSPGGRRGCRGRGCPAAQRRSPPRPG